MAASTLAQLPPPQPVTPWTASCGQAASNAPNRRPLTDEELLHTIDEFLYHGEIRDLIRGQRCFERVAASLHTEDLNVLIPPCLEELEYSALDIRCDTLSCLMYISFGCTLCDVPTDALVAAMRRNASVLARHDAMPMFVRSLDFLLSLDAEAERGNVKEGMLELQLRSILNCIYLQVLLNENDDQFVRSLELSQGRHGCSLATLLFEATKSCADSEKIPVKKAILLLLRVLQCLLDVPDRSLYPMPNPAEPSPGTQPPGANVAGAFGTGGVIQKPQIREFQAFTSLHLHERNLWAKYSTFGRPVAIEEALQIIQRYKDEFLMNYRFHPSEISFMQNTPFLDSAFTRYEQLRAQGMVSVAKPFGTAPPPMPDLTAVDAQQAAHFDPSALGTLQEAMSNSGAGVGATRPSGRDEESDSDTSLVSMASTDSETGSNASQSSMATVVSNTSAAGTVIHVAADSADSAGDARVNMSRTDGSEWDELGSLEEPPAARANVNDDGSHVRKKRGPRKHVLGADLSDVDVRDCTQDRAPSAVFQRIYLAIFPRLTETVVLLLRLLLTSCSNVENYPGVIDMSRERHATAIHVGTEADKEVDLTAFTQFEKFMPSEAAEMHRHREIMAAAVSAIILILLKQSRRSVAEQFSSLAQLITDSNGALVVLKFLNQDLSAALEPRDPLPVMQCLHGTPVPPGTCIVSWPVCATMRLVEVLYLLCKDSPERVRKYLIHYKAPFILKRLHRIENQQVQSLVLKLLKKQVRYLPRKWKQANMKAISAIYTLVPMPPLDDWLLNEPFGEPSTEGPSQADIRASNVVYNEALHRHLSSSPGRAGPGPQGAYLEGHVAAMQALKADNQGSPRAAAAVADNVSLNQQFDASDSTLGVPPAIGLSSMSMPVAGAGSGVANGDIGSYAGGCGVGRTVVASGGYVPNGEGRLLGRSAAFAIASMPGLGISPLASGSNPHSDLSSAVFATDAGARRGQSSSELLLERFDDEMFGYARMFPEYVPAGCQ